MKINLRESLNKIDLATDNRYDLLNTFNSKKLSDDNKKKLAEAIENNSMASVNRILHESEEQLFKVVISSMATKRDFESALYEDEAEEIVDYYGGRWIDENGFEWDMYVEEDDDSTEHAMIDNSYDMEDDDERAQRKIDTYDQTDRDWEYVESLTEANYGGAYDIDPEMFWTKDDLIEFSDAVCDKLTEKFGYQYDIADVGAESNNNMYILIEDTTHGIEADVSFRIKMSRIRAPRDLMKYLDTVVSEFVKKFEEEYQYYDFDESLSEDYDDFDPKYDARYEVNAYYGSPRRGNYAGLEDDFYTDDFEEVKDWVWEKCQKGLYINVVDRENGNQVNINTENYDFESDDAYRVFDDLEELSHLNESLNESMDLSDVEEVKEIKFKNDRVNNLRGIFSNILFIDALNEVGLDKFKIRTSRLKNVSQGDIKDSWYDLKRNGWSVSIERDDSLNGFNEVYVFEKIQNESLKEDIEEYSEEDFDIDYDEADVEPGNFFFADGKNYVWEERIAGPTYLDFDKWAVWSAREITPLQDFIIGKNEQGGYDVDEDAYIAAVNSKSSVYFVVEEDTGFIDWGPVETSTEAQDFLNGKVEDWENDEEYEEVEIEEESLNESRAIRNDGDYEVTLHYDDIGDGKEYDYTLGYDEVVDYLRELAWANGDGPEDLNEDEYLEWIMDNFDELADKYELNVLNYFESEASQYEYDHRNDEP